MPGATIGWRDSLKIGTAEREQLFLEAYDADPDAALRATSWGGPQIMGFNAAAAGFSDAAGMVAAMSDREIAHLDAFLAFVVSKRLVAALRARDWRAFAKVYNGSGQVAFYAVRMQNAYRGFVA